MNSLRFRFMFADPYFVGATRCFLDYWGYLWSSTVITRIVSSNEAPYFFIILFFISLCFRHVGFSITLQFFFYKLMHLIWSSGLVQLTHLQISFILIILSLTLLFWPAGFLSTPPTPSALLSSSWVWGPGFSWKSREIGSTSWTPFACFWLI